MRLQFDELFKDWNCATCTAEDKEWRGHYGPPAQGDYLIELLEGQDPERFTRCPLLAITRETVGWLTVYGDYEKGILPWEGGLYRQPARWYHAMKVIGAALGRCERERLEEIEASADKGPASSRGKSADWDTWAAGG